MAKSPDMAQLRRLCPDYPPTPHWTDDLSDGHDWCATEKLDGANAALFLDNGQLHIRNRTHILQRGYYKDTPAKAQFVPLWAWAQAHKRNLLALERCAGAPIVVHGEWLWAVHGVRYHALAEPFVAFAVSRQHARGERFVDPHLARAWLESCGWTVPTLIGTGMFDPAWLTERTSAWGQEAMEGVVLARGDGVVRTAVAKWVRPGYLQNSEWNPDQLVRQEKER